MEIPIYAFGLYHQNIISHYYMILSLSLNMQGKMPLAKHEVETHSQQIKL